MVIKYLMFEETCAGAPETYRVYNMQTRPILNCVSFIRLTGGKLTCNYVIGKTQCGDLKTETIYTEEFEYKHQEEFENEEQRWRYLNVIADKICERIEAEDSVNEQTDS